MKLWMPSHDWSQDPIEHGYSFLQSLALCAASPRKRQRTGALQDASRSFTRTSLRRFWTAAVLCRFQARWFFFQRVEHRLDRPAHTAGARPRERSLSPFTISRAIRGPR